MFWLAKLFFLLSLLLSFPGDLFAGDPHLNAQVDQLVLDVAAIVQKMDGLQYVQWVQSGLYCIIIILVMWNIWVRR